MDLAGKDFWEGFWNNPAGRSFGNLSFFFRAFSALLREHAPAGTSALEVGCGASVWLPYLAGLGVDAWGVDYSDVGVELLKRHLASQGVAATVIKGDVFDPHVLPEHQFDLVFSLGLLEHFSESAPLIQRFADLCRPGGKVLTLVPNFHGFWGTVQRAVDKPFYDAHRLYDTTALDAVHTELGLEIVQPARYFGGISPLVVNYATVLKRMPPLVAKGLFAGTWATQQAICWTTAALPQGIRNPPALAAHLVGVYRVPAKR